MRSVCRRAAIAAVLLVIALTTFLTIATFEGLATGGEREQAGDPAAYHIVVGTSEAGGGATWTYTITKAVAGAKDLGQLVISLHTCGDRSATLAHITAATVNGVNWLDKLDALEGKTGSGAVLTLGASRQVHTFGAHVRCSAHIGRAHQVHTSGSHVRCAPGVSTEREHPSCVPVVRTAPGVRT